MRTITKYELENILHRKGITPDFVIPKKTTVKKYGKTVRKIDTDLPADTLINVMPNTIPSTPAVYCDGGKYYLEDKLTVLKRCCFRIYGQRFYQDDLMEAELLLEDNGWDFDLIGKPQP